MRLLTSRSGVRASQGAFAHAVKSPSVLQDVWQLWLGTRHVGGSGYAARPPATRAGVSLAVSSTTFLFLGKHVWGTTCHTKYFAEPQVCTSFLSPAGQSVRLLTSRSGARASQGAACSHCWRWRRQRRPVPAGGAPCGPPPPSRARGSSCGAPRGAARAAAPQAGRGSAALLAGLLWQDFWGLHSPRQLP